MGGLWLYKIFHSLSGLTHIRLLMMTQWANYQLTGSSLDWSKWVMENLLSPPPQQLSILSFGVTYWKPRDREWRVLLVNQWSANTCVQDAHFVWQQRRFQKVYLKERMPVVMESLLNERQSSLLTSKTITWPKGHEFDSYSSQYACIHSKRFNPIVIVAHFG